MRKMVAPPWQVAKKCLTPKNQTNNPLLNNVNNYLLPFFKIQEKPLFLFSKAKESVSPCFTTWLGFPIHFAPSLIPFAPGHTIYP